MQLLLIVWGFFLNRWNKLIDIPQNGLSWAVQWQMEVHWSRTEQWPHRQRGVLKCARFVVLIYQVSANTFSKASICLSSEKEEWHLPFRAMWRGTFFKHGHQIVTGSFLARAGPKPHHPLTDLEGSGSCRLCNDGSTSLFPARAGSLPTDRNSKQLRPCFQTQRVQRDHHHPFIFTYVPLSLCFLFSIKLLFYEQEWFISRA